MKSHADQRPRGLSLPSSAPPSSAGVTLAPDWAPTSEQRRESHCGLATTDRKNCQGTVGWIWRSLVAGGGRRPGVGGRTVVSGPDTSRRKIAYRTVVVSMA
jgi:hypothetical protein